MSDHPPLSGALAPADDPDWSRPPTPTPSDAQFGVAPADRAELVRRDLDRQIPEADGTPTITQRTAEAGTRHAESDNMRPAGRDRRLLRHAAPPAGRRTGARGRHAASAGGHESLIWATPSSANPPAGWNAHPCGGLAALDPDTIPRIDKARGKAAGSTPSNSGAQLQAPRDEHRREPARASGRS